LIAAFDFLCVAPRVQLLGDFFQIVTNVLDQVVEYFGGFSIEAVGFLMQRRFHFRLLRLLHADAGPFHNDRSQSAAGVDGLVRFGEVLHECGERLVRFIQLLLAQGGVADQPGAIDQRDPFFVLVVSLEGDRHCGAAFGLFQILQGDVVIASLAKRFQKVFRWFHAPSRDSNHQRTNGDHTPQQTTLD
jgi:hypothetical protein